MFAVEHCLWTKTKCAMSHTSLCSPLSTNDITHKCHLNLVVISLSDYLVF